MTGAELSRWYYVDVVRPLLDAYRPGLPHAAGRLGGGSDVLGLDDAMSRDHDWGLRLTLLVDDGEVAAVDALLVESLPDKAFGLPVRFATSWDAEVRHRVEVTTVEAFTSARLGTPAFTAVAEPSAVDWLTLTGQAVLEVTAGPTFHDDGRLGAVRELLAWYPDDVWRQVVAADWARVAEELPFVGRTGARGDDLGSAVIAARCADALVHLGFLLDRRWPPYPKWRGRLFAGLPRAGVATAPLRAAVTAASWQGRESGLCEAAELLAAVQREAGLPAPDPVTEPFHDRPFRGIRDAATRLPGGGDVGPGSVEQWVGAVPLLTGSLRRSLAAASVPQ